MLPVVIVCIFIFAGRITGQTTENEVESGLDQRNLFLLTNQAGEEELLRIIAEMKKMQMTTATTRVPPVGKNATEMLMNDTTSTVTLGPFRALPEELLNTTCGAFPACTVQYISEENRTIDLVVHCDRPVASFIAALTIILCVIIVLCNLLIIVVTLRTKSLRRPNGCFKLSLAAADLVAGAIVLPSAIYNIFNEISYSDVEPFPLSSIMPRYTATAVVCGIAGILSSVAAVYSLLLLAIDNFLSMRWPLQYRIGDVMTKTRAIVAVLIIWLFAIMVSAFPILSNDFIEYGLNYVTMQYIPVIKPSSIPNIFKYWHAVVYVIFVWGIPFVATWTLTIMSSMESNRMLKGLRQARDHSMPSASALDKVERNFRRTVAVVLVMFTVTVLPVLVVLLYIAFSPPGYCFSGPTSIAFFISSYILICGRFLNVIIYNIFHKEFREASWAFYADILNCCGCGDKFYPGSRKRTMSKSDASEKKPFRVHKSGRGKNELKAPTTKTRSTSVNGDATGSSITPSSREQRPSDSSVDTAKTSPEPKV
ncbi:unnamed protein product [Clavelina lepadiformis]|uniref:G-protein coupled receptors family 1 profile domain-containing protein n=1 Tax=Clavelina lepadiformis TaxID=159417 RepID=A0ABP0FTP9_CLALP